MTVVLVAVLVFAAVMLVPGRAAPRARRLLLPGDDSQPSVGDRATRGGGCNTASGRLGVVPWRRERPVAADEAVRAVAELAALLRAGLPAQRVWAYLPSRSLAASGCSAPARECQQTLGCRQRGDSAWELLLEAADHASREGRSVATVLRAGLTECPPDVRTVVHGLAAAWDVSERTGAPTADVFDRLAQGLRAETDARDARAVAMAGPRATARILAWLPFVGLALGQLVGADPVRTLLTTPLGRACGVAGALLAVAAAVWTRRLVGVAARVR